MTVFRIFIVFLIAIIVLFVYSALVVSSRQEQIEQRFRAKNKSAETSEQLKKRDENFD